MSDPVTDPSTRTARRPRSLIPQESDVYGWLDRRPRWRRAQVVAVAALIGWLLVPDTTLSTSALDNAVEGSPVSENIKAPLDLEVTDGAATQAAREAAASGIRTLYDFDRSLTERTCGAISHAFARMRQNMQANPRPGLEASRTELEAALAVSVPAAEFELLHADGFSPHVEAELRRLFSDVQRGFIVAQLADLDQDRKSGIAVKTRAGEGSVVQPLETVEGIIDLAQAREEVRRRAAHLVSGVSPALKLEVTRLAARLLEPNLSANRAETEMRRAEARQAVKPITLLVKKGEMVIRDGERVTRRHLAIFSVMRESTRAASSLLSWLGGALLCLLMASVGGVLAGGQGSGKVLLGARDLTFLATLFVCSVGGARLFLSVAHMLHDNHPTQHINTFLFLMPLATGAMMVRLVLTAKAALLFSISHALLVGLLPDGDRFLGLFAVLGSVVAIASLGHIAARSTLISAGVRVGIVQVVCAAGIFFISGKGAWGAYAWTLPAAFLGGVISALLTLATAPLVEWAFGYTTDLQLLELANLNHPALKELIVQAPGSYHHSIIVGALVEAAAESCGANSLMARVMAYYHDLGKGCNPGYFVENQRMNQNPHDKLKPSMSAMIIRRHVTDGLDLAKKHRLGSPILAGIAQHHGTTLINYFYHKAREQAEDADSVSEAEYRYPGQKPQSREAALVMLGDSIEAASRALQETTPARLQGLVNRIISQKFTDGQLEECDLTLRDLHTIAKSFSRVLNSIYHHRPEYPDGEPKGPRRAEPHAPAPHPVEEPPDSLRRLGL